MLQKITVEAQAEAAERIRPLHPVGAAAAAVARRMRESNAPVLYIAANSQRAAEIAALLQILVDDRPTALLPRWDGSAEDGIAASPEAVGARMSVFRWLIDRKKRPAAVIATAAALARRTPPRAAWCKGMHLEFTVGDPIDPAESERALRRLGYVLDERCDEPGEAAVRGRILEVFPAAAPRPCRIQHAAGRITAIRSFDPVSQRSVAETHHLIVDSAVELVGETRDASDATGSIGRFYGASETLFDYMPDCEVVIENDRATLLAAAALDEVEGDRGDFVDRSEWEREIASRLEAVVEDSREEPDAHVPAFAGEAEPAEALRLFAEPLLADGYRLVVAGAAGDLLQRWSRRVGRVLDNAPRTVGSWSAALRARKGGVLRFAAPLGSGFVAHEDRVVVVTLRDLAGQEVGHGGGRAGDAFRSVEEPFAIGDAVVHFDHGVGILEGLETVGDTGEEALRLRYADDAKLLVPLDEIGALWRYGSEESDVTLDRLKGERWREKRDRIVVGIGETAERMVERLAERDRERTTPIRPDRVRFERFSARFGHELTAGQAEAVNKVLADLRSGRPMDRLLCGDVGYGKTEVALRAAAAAVFSGRQAVIVAPTTVLAQQHFRLFERRFARDDVAVALLSRHGSAAERRETLRRIADGSVSVVVATHAVCGKEVRFQDLALAVIDEEQRFGVSHKKRIRNLSPGLHVLAMTATPIPQTLQAGFVGLHEVSVIDTAPVRRRPVRTRVAPLGDRILAEALNEERSHGGRSFLVCPRIEDLQPMRERLERIAPHLAVAMLHGEMPAGEADEAMLLFARGEADVLLATNIVESGLDVPQANLIVVYRPDRFGLAQLHQLRGRVGRGARRGTALLLTEPDAAPGEAAARRLATLQRLDRLGSGFAISRRDLDLRGAGELLGDEQAGHLQMVGLSLYRRTLEHALRAARGEEPDDEWRCDVAIGLSGRIPADYLGEPELRIELAASLDSIGDEAALDRLAGEVADRFGPMPDALRTGFALAAIRLRATRLGVRRLDAGPKAVAATFSRVDAEKTRKRLGSKGNGALRWRELRLVEDRPTEGDEERLAAVEGFLDRLG